MHIITNLERFPLVWTAPTGQSGTADVTHNFSECLRELQRADLILVNSDVDLVLKLCQRFLLVPHTRKPLVAVDMVLTRPEGALAWAAALRKRLLLSRVDHFINYFKRSDGYRKYYGITPERSSFVHFKPNIRYRYRPWEDREGEYVLCFGKSRRDYDTFFRAAARIPFPCAIPRPNIEALRKHGSRFTYSLQQLPSNVRLLEDDGSERSMIRALEGAKVVALPILKKNLVAGIGVYLNAMYLRKCVIITEGSGASDVLADEALFVPPEDPIALAAAIRRCWEDDVLRTTIARRGHTHACSLGGEPELLQRILEATVRWFESSLYAVSRRPCRGGSQF
jgi:glycosyltransferase involved in cell wall biosynthesis